MKNTAALIGIFVVACGGYVAYRYISLPTRVNLGEWSKVQSLPPTVCTFEEGTFENSQRGTMYVYKGNVRMEGVYQEGGRSVPVHIVITPDKLVYSWTDGDTRGFVDPLGAQNSRMSAFQKISCAPWWLPDAALVKPPSLVAFE